jgi:UDP-glucuronate 4-epimerase
VTRVLVTGAAGFIGSHLAEALIARGDEVTGLDSFDPFYPRAVKERNLLALATHPGFRLVEGDIRDRTTVAAQLTADTVVVHLAAKAGVRPSLVDPAGYASTNVEGTAAVLDACRQAGATRVVFGSSSSVYGDDSPPPFREDAPCVAPVSPYAATKRAGELLLASLAEPMGLRGIALRFFTVYGPRQRPDLAIRAFARRLMRNEPLPIFGDGTDSRDYTYVDDIVRGVVAAIDRTARVTPGTVETYNLGGDRPVPLARMVETLAAALGVTPQLDRRPRQPGDVHHTSADLTRARSGLGYDPQVSFEDGIARFVTWIRDDARHQS